MKANLIYLLPLIAVVIGQEIDLAIVTSKFIAAKNDLQLPVLESKVEHDNKLQEFVNITDNLVIKLVTELYKQTRLGSLLNINEAEGTFDRIMYTLNAKQTNNTDKVINRQLIKINNQLLQFLHFQPGKQQLQPETLPPLPDVNEESPNNVNIQPMNNSFSNTSSVVKNQLSGIRIAYKKIFNEGQKLVRMESNKLQEQFRSKFLNKHLLRGYYDVVKQIFENTNVIQNHVKRETWDEFNSLGNQVKTIFDQLKPPKENF